MEAQSRDKYAKRSRMLLATVILAAGVALPASAADKASLRLDWKIYGTHGLFYAGEMKGFYKDEGFDLEIGEGNGSAKVVTLMGAKGDTFGFVAGVSTLQAAAKGVPVRSVYGVMQKSPLSVMSLAEQNIKKPFDLVGKTVATSGGGVGSALFNTFLKINNIDPGKVTLAAIGIAGRNQAVLAGTVAAMVGFSVTDVPRMELLGHKVNVMHFADWGFNTVANGIIVNTEVENESPELVRRFLRALTKSIEYAKANPDEVVAYMAKKFPQAKEESLRRELIWTFDLLTSESTKGKPLGWQAEGDWAETQRVLSENGQIEKTMPVGTYFTNAYLPK